MESVTFILNGREITAEYEGRMTLLKYLRNVECMKGSKEGCSTGHCGAGTVLLDGKPVRSCGSRMDKLVGKSVVTFEALHGADGDVLDLTIPLTPAGSPLRARGRVVYLRETPGARILAGVQFLSLSARHREALGKKIRDRMLRGAARVAARC